MCHKKDLLTNFQVLLTIGTMLYSRSLELIHHAWLWLYFSRLATSNLPSSQTEATTILLSVPMSFTILDTSYKWNHEVICASVTSLFHLVQCAQGSPMLSCMQDFLRFYDLTTFYFVSIPHFLYPFIHWWTFGLYPHLDYCK